MTDPKPASLPMHPTPDERDAAMLAMLVQLTAALCKRHAGLATELQLQLEQVLQHHDMSDGTRQAVTEWVGLLDSLP